MFDTLQGRSLVLVTAWFAMYNSGPCTQPWELLSGVAAVHVELVVVKPSSCFIQDT